MNLTKEERTAIVTLKQDHSIIIRPADKGGGLVILDYKDYHNEAMGQLNDTKTYQKLRGDPVNEYKRILTDTLNQAVDLQCISRDTYYFLLPSFPQKYYKSTGSSNRVFKK